jgi:hypothetical protein
VRTELVVILPPRFDQLPGFGEPEEKMFIKALVAKFAVEALDESVLHRLAGLDVVPGDPLGGPAQHRIAGQFGSVVRGEVVMAGKEELLRWLRCKPKPSGGSAAMTKTHSTPGNATLVAVDIAKSHHDLLIEATAPARRRHFRLANSLEDFERLADYLRRLDAPAVIGFEATGNYHRSLAHFLHRQGFALRLIPTLALARTPEAMHYADFRIMPRCSRQPSQVMRKQHMMSA